MVWLEAALVGKGASLLAPVMKISSAGSGAATVAAIAPQGVAIQAAAVPNAAHDSFLFTPDLAQTTSFLFTPDLSQGTGLDSHLSSFGSSLMTRMSGLSGDVWSRVEALSEHGATFGQALSEHGAVLGHTVGMALSSFMESAKGLHLSAMPDIFSGLAGPVCFTSAAMAMLHRCGYFREESDGRITHPYVPFCMYLVATADCFMAAAVVQSLGVSLPVPLRTWAIGGLLLSFPASAFVDQVAKLDGVRWAYAMDVGITTVSYGWLVWGTYLLSNSGDALNAAPVLWWTAFGQCVFSWSAMTCGIGTMIFVTVISLAAGAAPKPEERSA